LAVSFEEVPDGLGGRRGLGAGEDNLGVTGRES
jgi:hypothetical protein